jgi:putative ABC transport system ATP-binding protein
MVTHDPVLAARAQRNVHIVDGVATDMVTEPASLRPAMSDAVADLRA